ncbi:hypothetical protein F4560_007874 [Saccharothrix ecbatanensis]|uniref:PIN domain-containing protein n=1 Tax=Saccharothrix ecbatanensis TaxID=1105145 RepID=A0A7W9M5E7_9PSEU|nr:PIN domain-containing protein [Saccharothrix ecbatanensis]MBB5808106.1 hypothetical protein [Saccharothrix ecbatanensis]
MAITRVFADTNTLYPFYLCDLLLHCAEEDLFRVLWSEDLLTELVEVIPRSGHKSRQAVVGLCAAIREVFPDDEVPRSAYEHLIAGMPGTDPTTGHTPPLPSPARPTYCSPVTPKGFRRRHWVAAASV